MSIELEFHRTIFVAEGEEEFAITTRFYNGIHIKPHLNPENADKLIVRNILIALLTKLKVEFPAHRSV